MLLRHGQAKADEKAEIQNSLPKSQTLDKSPVLNSQEPILKRFWIKEYLENHLGVQNEEQD